MHRSLDGSQLTRTHPPKTQHGLDVSNSACGLDDGAFPALDYALCTQVQKNRKNTTATQKKPHTALLLSYLSHSPLFHSRADARERMLGSSSQLSGQRHHLAPRNPMADDCTRASL